MNSPNLTPPSQCINYRIRVAIAVNAGWVTPWADEMGGTLVWMIIAVNAGWVAPWIDEMGGTLD
jgi:hypothetical protein